MTGRHATGAEQSPDDDWRSQFKHPQCPIVLALEAAGLVVRGAIERGEIDKRIGEERLRIIGLKGMAAASAQEVFGCPRDGLEDGERELAERSFACSVPVSLVDQFAFGASSEMAGHLLSNRGMKPGF